MFVGRRRLRWRVGLGWIAFRRTGDVAVLLAFNGNLYGVDVGAPAERDASVVARP